MCVLCELQICQFQTLILFFRIKCSSFVFNDFPILDFCFIILIFPALLLQVKSSRMGAVVSGGREAMLSAAGAGLIDLNQDATGISRLKVKVQR